MPSEANLKAAREVVDGGRISYLNGDLDKKQHITRLNLEDFRHALGWCSEPKFYAGKTGFSVPRISIFLLA
jgi:hypothetical protein